MSILSLADFLERPPVGAGVVCTATVSGRGTTVVDGSARGEGFSVATREDFSLATREDFFMAADNPGRTLVSSRPFPEMNHRSDSPIRPDLQPRGTTERDERLLDPRRRRL